MVKYGAHRWATRSTLRPPSRPGSRVDAGFQVLDYVTTPGSPVRTKASFAIQDGVSGLQSRHPQSGASYKTQLGW